MRIGDIVWSHAEHTVSCAYCSTRLCADDKNWKEHALVKRTNAATRLNGGEFGPTYRVYEHPELELAEIFCPECKALLSVELYLRGEPLRWTYRSREAAAAGGYDAVADFAANPAAWLTFGSPG